MGEILLIDEIHTPDSSRYWLADSYAGRVAAGREPDMIDKEFFRLWFGERCDPYKDAELPVPPDELIAELASRYIQLFEKITGTTFAPDLRPLEEDGAGECARVSETILIVGSGAREDAIAKALARSLQRPELVCFSGARNPAIVNFGARRMAWGALLTLLLWRRFAVQHHVTLAVLGPEAPLAAGVADALWAVGIAVVGPTQSLARVESTQGLYARAAGEVWD